MSDMRLPRPVMREEFRKRLRVDLMNEAVALAEERRLRRASFGRWLSLLEMRLRPVAVAAAIVAVVVTGGGAAAAGSLPGDPAFALKRAAEAVELALAPGDEAKVRVLSAQAERRLADLERTAERPDKAPTASAEYEAAVRRLADAVAALRTAEPATKREAVEQVVEAAREKHVQVLEDLKDRLPEPAKQGIERAIEQTDKLAPGVKPGERTPRPSERPGGAPRRSGEPERTAPAGRETERPRATETPRGGRPSVSPSPRR